MIQRLALDRPVVAGEIAAPATFHGFQLSQECQTKILFTEGMKQTQRTRSVN
jgi:hypothetical protein